MIRVGVTPRQWALTALLLALLTDGLWLGVGGELPGQSEDMLREGHRGHATPG